MIVWYDDFWQRGGDNGERLLAAGYGWVAIPLGLLLVGIVALLVWAVVRGGEDR